MARSSRPKYVLYRTDTFYELGAQAIWVSVQTQDGARFFTNEGDAYRYMWNSSFDADGNVQQEVAGFLTPKGVLVLPTEGKTNYGAYTKNTPRSASYEYLPLGWRDGKPFVKFEGKFLTILSLIHTHPNTQKFGQYEVGADRDVQSYYNVPMYLIRPDGFYTLNGRIGSQQEFFDGKKSLIDGKF